MRGESIFRPDCPGPFTPLENSPAKIGFREGEGTKRQAEVHRMTDESVLSL